MLEWRSHPDFARYEVSSTGLVRVKQTGRLLSPYENKKGHRRVDLYAAEGRSKRYVHRLVLETFVGPCPAGHEACHGDGNSRNNCLTNLRWDTASANWEDARKHGTARTGDHHHWTKVTSEGAALARALRARGLLQRQIAEQLGVCQQAVSHILRRAA